ncbi:MAG: hypothetical protein JWQ90_78 [Hydrocarboniphaga sp.]|uniref:hypothetical protein n=1 Tax=Hydrocarboniphaga sp. TaxID=2033016 RepID=UPI002633A399|nr:hypothetical protein [Hydrocarboniphaga sp.]MDB5967628.1 hypothetical protein [Hydrocarboniphaga sp.]
MALLITGLFLSELPAQARDPGLSDRLRLPPAGFTPGGNDRHMSPSEAARIAQQQNGGGRVLAVERNDRGYRVKLLKNGDVRIVYVPGN